MARAEPDGKDCTGWQGLHRMARDAPDGKDCTGWQGMHLMARDATVCRSSCCFIVILIYISGNIFITLVSGTHEMPVIFE